MTQGILYDLDKQKFDLFVIEEGNLLHFHAKRLKGESFHVSRSMMVNGVEASRIEQSLHISALPAFDRLDAYVWFARGIGGIPLRLTGEAT